MKMTRNEMRILFTFGCADREATVTRLFYVGSITVDPTTRKQILELAKNRILHIFYYKSINNKTAA